MLDSKAPPSVTAELKENQKVYVGFPVCRRCFLGRNYSQFPNCQHATADLCAIRSCENESAYIVNLSPYDVRL